MRVRKIEQLLMLWLKKCFQKVALKPASVSNEYIPYCSLKVINYLILQLTECLNAALFRTNILEYFSYQHLPSGNWNLQLPLSAALDGISHVQIFL